MKKITLLLSIIALSIYSCGDSKSKNVEDEKVKTETIVKKIKKVKTLAERKEEGKVVRTELAEHLKEIPENLVFKESVVNAMGLKKSVFEAEIVDEETNSLIEKWLQEQLSNMEADGWEKSQLQENDVISGIIYNSYSMKRVQGGESTVIEMFSLTSAYAPNLETYTIFVKAYLL